jgi:hypothetical protein
MDAGMVDRPKRRATVPRPGTTAGSATPVGLATPVPETSAPSPTARAPDTAAPDAAAPAPYTAAPDAAGPVSAGPVSAGPVSAGPVSAGPVSAGPVTAGPVSAGLPQVTKALGITLGSTTALSGILFYFGWSRAYYFYDYFGVDSSLLGLSTNDYLQLSVDGLFVPLVVVAAVTLVGLWAWPLLDTLIRGRLRETISRVVVPVAGMLLLLNGLSAILVRTPLNRPLVSAPLCLAAGTTLVVLAIRGVRGPASVGAAITEWAVIVVLVGLALFWAANDYSAAVGRARARQMAAQLSSFPDATLYSEKSLSLRHPGVRETRCANKDATYAFRYDGLKLILQSGDQYLFLPATWSRRNGVAVVMPRTDATRLEFVPVTTPVTGSKTC